MAAFFWIGGTSNWNTIGNWSTTSGGTSNGAIPTTTSDVTFDGVGTNGNTASIVSANITILSLTFTTGYTSSVTINTAVVLTIGGNFTDKTNHTWVVNGTGAMTISAASSINSGGKTFPGPVTFSGANTKTLSGGNDWTISGALTINTSSVTVINLTTAEKISCAGFIPNSNVTGTATIVVTGGTWGGGGTTGNNIKLQGDVTLAVSINLTGGTITYVSGTITNTGNTVIVAGNTTFDTNGMVWNNITMQATTLTITINSLLTGTGLLTISSSSTALTFAGTAGFNFDSFSCASTAACTITLVNSVTYTIVSSFLCFQSRSAAKVAFTSNHATLKANLILQNESAVCYVLANFTRIDASGGRPIITFIGPANTGCINIYAISTTVFYNPITSFNRGRRRLSLTNVNKRVVLQ